MATTEKLANQIENVEKRAVVLENRVKTLKSEALAKKKAKDNRGKTFLIISDSICLGAIHAMK